MAQAEVAYLDGAEHYLLDVLAREEAHGPHDGRLERHVRDWPSLYHLSPYRWALLDALDLPPGLDVLELGAGCGALTSWLADEARSVVAVEGSAPRADVIRARCAHAANVEVRCADAVTLEGAEDADLVTLVGVLEYAARFGAAAGDGPAEEAALAMLRTARRHVRPNGALVIAIENRLGLKYLQGHPEDHEGRPFVGVEGYWDATSAVTWSRQEIEALVLQAGFDSVEMLLPFPDYKLPQAVVNPDRLEPGLRIAQWITTPFRDPATGLRPGSFEEALALGEFERAGLLADLANSFLVIARRGTGAAGGPRERDWVARHYALDRVPGGRKRLTLDVDGVVRAARVGPPADIGAEAGRIGLRQRVHDAPFVRGVSLARTLLHLPRASRLDALAGMLGEHAAFLRERFGRPDGTLEPSALDATPYNVIVEDETGQRVLIDLEWEVDRQVDLDFVLFRSAYHLVTRWPESLAAEDADAVALAAELVGRALGAPIDAERIEALVDLETTVQRAVSGDDAKQLPRRRPAPPEPSRDGEHTNGHDALDQRLVAAEARAADAEARAVRAELNVEAMRATRAWRAATALWRARALVRR